MLGLEEVPITIVKALAPYIIWHRVEFVREFLEQRPHYGDKLSFAKYIVDLVHQKFVVNYKKYLEWINKAKMGNLTSEDKSSLNIAEKSDVVVSTDIREIIKEFQDATYRKYSEKIRKTVEEIRKLKEEGDINDLIDRVYSTIKELEESEKLKLHARNELIGELYDLLFELANFEVRYPLEEWRKIHQLIELRIHKKKKEYDGLEVGSVLNSFHIFLQKVNKSLFEFKRKALFMVFNSLPELKLDVIVSKIGEDGETVIAFRFKGGKTAVILKEILEIKKEVR